MLWSYKKCQKIGVGRGLCQVKTKKSLVERIPHKIFGTKWTNLVKLDWKLKFWYLFLHVF